MEKYSFFNAEQTGEGQFDRTYLAEDIAAYFASFVGNGVYANSASNLKVESAGAMKVTVKPGKGWINGYYYENTEDLPLLISNANGAKNRIDSVVMRLDLLNRYIKVFVKTGAVAAQPVAPDLTRSAEVWELELAQIKVNAGTVSIGAADIIDSRFDSLRCGIVAGVITQIDATGLFNQYDIAFSEWFAGVQDTLSGDVAGNILNLVNVFTATFALDGWKSVSGHYEQEVACAGMKPTYSTTNPWIYKTGVKETDEVLQDSLSELCEGYITAGEGTIKAVLYGGALQSDLTIYMRRAE